MKTILLLLLLLGALTAGAVDRITATIAVTNAPIGNTNTLTINANVRTFTNTVTGSPGTLIQETNSIPWSATNILNQLTDYRISQFHFLGQSQSTNVTVVGAVGEALTVTLAGGWGFVTYSTQTVSSPTFIVRVPLTVEQTSNRTHIASLLVQGQSDNSTNSFATNAVALSNYITRGASPEQTVASPLHVTGTLKSSVSSQTNASFYNATNRGYVVALTNGYWTNGTFDSPKTTNLVNRGNAISSPGTNGANSEQFGTGARATNSASTAVGYIALAFGENSTAVGTGSSALGSGTTVLGTGASSDSYAGTAIGNVAEANAIGATALGQGAIAGHSNSVALGASSLTTTTNQIRLGTSSETVSVPGVLEVSGTQTNTIFSGTNKFQLAVSFTATNITSLANGANDVDPGFKTYLRVSGPSAAYSIDKIDRGYDGRILIIQKTDSYTMTVVNSSGAGVLGDTAKILTGTGGTLTITNNPGFVQLIYDATASRWGVINKSN